MADAQTIDGPPEHLSHRAIRDLPVAMLIADPWQDDCPIIYVNRAFTRMTGYTEEMAIGRNCRFLQGPDTNPDTRLAIRTAVARAEEISVDIVNYRADGSSFLNHLMIAPLFDESGALTHFLGVQAIHDGAAETSRQVAELGERLRMLQKRVRNHLSMIFSLIRLQARDGDPSIVIKVLASRVHAISLLYDDFVLPGADESKGVDLGAYVSRLAAHLNDNENRPRVRLNISVQPVAVSVDDAARIGLIVSEVITNALEHAFEASDHGQISVKLLTVGGRVRIVVSDNGRGIAEHSWPDLETIGGRIVTGLVFQLGGEIGVSHGEGGRGTEISVAFDMPRSEALMATQRELN